MKKAIAFMTGSAVLMSVTPAVYADFGFATEPEEVAVFVQEYIDQKIPGKAKVETTDTEVIVKFYKTSFLNPTQQGNILMENLRGYLLSNDADYSIVRLVYDESVTEDEKPAEEEKTSEEEKPADPAYVSGDIDGSGTIDVTDLTEVSLALLGDRDLTDEQQKAADVDGDGSLSLADLAKIRQYLSKKIDSLD
ncbi:MAG: dockerin type I repeat-containing protein [Oscillospiraceae bacterium]|nr:dockerin type I repeat-containing protein [Oscillospiraceae bacterium]MBR3535086.1 dockerin type I repeat-containing protein [Oscillospiraceae bacterium]MBR6836791.1 dockerin type I repeat-containing protein [Oscillospiraceae bacterium]